MENYYYYFLKGILFYYFLKFYFILCCFTVFLLNLNELKLSKREKPVCPCALASFQAFGSLGWLVVIL